MSRDTWRRRSRRAPSGVSADELTRTVEAYNAAARGDQPDEQGRTTLTGGCGTPFPLDHPPYYPHPSTTVVLATYCGLTITPNTNVVNVFGDVIEGLYAAGELTGGLLGAGYVTGTSVGRAGIFGRLAGLAAASYARR